MTILRHTLVARQIRRLSGLGVRTLEIGEGAGLRFDPSGADLAYAYGHRELPVQHTLARHLRPGQIFYDIGANVGFFTIVAAKLVGGAGYVYAFEPVPTNVEAIKYNLRLNRQTQASVFAVAVAERSGTASLTLTRHIGGAVLSGAGAPPDATRTVTVETLAIDDGLHRGLLRPPAVIKIDVEGAELMVLQGMRETLAAYRPVVIFEVDDGDLGAMQAKWSACVALLAEHGYSVEALEGSYEGSGWNVAHGVAVPS